MSNVIIQPHNARASMFIEFEPKVDLWDVPYMLSLLPDKELITLQLGAQKVEDHNMVKAVNDELEKRKITPYKEGTLYSALVVQSQITREMFVKYAWHEVPSDGERQFIRGRLLTEQEARSKGKLYDAWKVSV